MGISAIFALLVPAALVRSRAVSHVAELAAENAAWRRREALWRKAEGLPTSRSLLDQPLADLPISPAAALALPRGWRNCVPGRAQAFLADRRY
jgi:hypothetical protein